MFGVVLDNSENCWEWYWTTPKNVRSGIGQLPTIIRSCPIPLLNFFRPIQYNQSCGSSLVFIRIQMDPHLSSFWSGFRSGFGSGFGSGFVSGFGSELREVPWILIRIHMETCGSWIRIRTKSNTDPHQWLYCMERPEICWEWYWITLKNVRSGIGQLPKMLGVVLDNSQKCWEWYWTTPKINQSYPIPLWKINGDC